MIIVPDASVILKWVLEKEDEPDHHQALLLQEALVAEQIEIRLPALWRYEVGNVLGLKQPAMAMELMSALLAYNFEEVPLRTDYALAVLEHMAALKSVTFYDSPIMCWPSGQKGSISRPITHMSNELPAKATFRFSQRGRVHLQKDEFLNTAPSIPFGDRKTCEIG
jgi:predicted nucleic acid-binding protein